MAKRNSYSAPMGQVKQVATNATAAVGGAARTAVAHVQHFGQGVMHSAPNRSGVGKQQSPRGAMHSAKTSKW